MDEEESRVQQETGFFLFPHFLAIVDVAKGSSSRLRLDNDIDQQVKGRPLTIKLLFTALFNILFY